MSRALQQRTSESAVYPPDKGPGNEAALSRPALLIRESATCSDTCVPGEMLLPDSGRMR